MLLHVALEVYPNLAVSVWHCALVFVCLLVSPSDQDLESEANPIAAHKLSLLATSTRFIIFGPGFFCLQGLIGTQKLFANPYPSAPRPLACPRVNARFLHRRKQPMLPSTKWQNPSHSARPAGLQEQSLMMQNSVAEHHHHIDNDNNKGSVIAVSENQIEEIYCNI